MSRSTSRSGYFRFGQKNQPSLLSRTIAASKLCRRDSDLLSQIDSKAVTSVDHHKPSKPPNLLFQDKGHTEEELKRTKEQLGAAEGDRDRALDELREMKQVANEANMRLNEALSPRKAREVYAELKTVKESLNNSHEELKLKDENIEILRIEFEKVKKFESNLAERDALVERLKEDLSKSKDSENRKLDLLTEINKRVQELEAEIERGQLSEFKMLNLMADQTNQLEQTKIELEESKLEIASLQEKIEKMEISSRQSSRDINGLNKSENNDSKRGAFESLKSEPLLVKEHPIPAQEGEKIASFKSKNLLDEIALLKCELKLATEAEEKSKNAMDDLALVLKEVATEANQAKEKLNSTQVELEHVKGEAEQLKALMRSTEDKYQNLLDEAKKESELHRNTADRLRLEAEESLLAWNGKEMGFVGCIKSADEERSIAQHENTRLAETLIAAENMTRTAKDENYKLRDILKQALNESNVAKEAANIARAENSQLKDCLAEKDDALHFITRENERLRINETAAHENVKELKRLLSTASTELKMEDKEQGGMFNISELKFLNEYEEMDERFVDEDPDMAEALKGSIFDPEVIPKSELRTPKSGSHHRRRSSVFTDGGGTPNSEDFEHLNGINFDDSDDRSSSRRRRAFLRRFSDLISRKSLHEKEPSIE